MSEQPTPTKQDKGAFGLFRTRTATSTIFSLLEVHVKRLEIFTLLVLFTPMFWKR